MLLIIMKNICTVFGLGNFTKMPGTLGSVAGVFLGFIFSIVRYWFYDLGLNKPYQGTRKQ